MTESEIKARTRTKIEHIASLILTIETELHSTNNLHLCCWFPHQLSATLMQKDEQKASEFWHKKSI